MAKFGFNVAEVEVSSSFGPLPPGDYRMVITDSAAKVTKSGDGQYIELAMQVIDGPHQGRRHWERLNVINSTEKAQQYARQALVRLCAACGKPDAEDTEELHDIEFIVRMEIDNTDATRNRIKAYLPANAKAASPAATARPAAPTPAAAKPRPWA